MAGFRAFAGLPHLVVPGSGAIVIAVQASPVTLLNDLGFGIQPVLQERMHRGAIRSDIAFVAERLICIARNCSGFGTPVIAALVRWRLAR